MDFLKKHQLQKNLIRTMIRTGNSEAEARDQVAASGLAVAVEGHRAQVQSADLPVLLEDLPVSFPQTNTINLTGKFGKREVLKPTMLSRIINQALLDISRQILIFAEVQA